MLLAAFGRPDRGIPASCTHVEMGATTTTLAPSTTAPNPLTREALLAATRCDEAVARLDGSVVNDAVATGDATRLVEMQTVCQDALAQVTVDAGSTDNLDVQRLTRSLTTVNDGLTTLVDGVQTGELSQRT